MSDLTTTQQQVLLGLAKGNCGNCSNGLWPGWVLKSARTPRTGDFRECPICNGTGQVYLLPDTVRVPCRAMIHDGQRCENTYENTKGCQLCHGLGWTPTTDGWKWWQVAGQYIFRSKEEKIAFLCDFYNAWMAQADLEEYLFIVLHRAMEAMGTVFPEYNVHEDGEILVDYTLAEVRGMKDAI